MEDKARHIIAGATDAPPNPENWPEITHYMTVVHDEPKPLPGSKFELQTTGMKDYQYTKIALIKYQKPHGRARYFVAFMPTHFLHENCQRLTQEPEWVLELQDKNLYIEEILEKPSDDFYTVDKFLKIQNSDEWMCAFNKLKDEQIIQNAARVFVSKVYSNMRTKFT